MTSTFRTILAELSDPTAEVDSIRHEHSPFHLATLADCYSPDSIDSPGAVFLARIARDVADHVDTDDMGTLYDLTDGDAAHEIADSAVPIYTHERWATFVDLGAYNEDPAGEMGDEGTDLTQTAGVALYLIADRLVGALAEELREALDAEEDEELPEDVMPDGTIIYYTRNGDGTITATTAHSVQVGPGTFADVDDARAYAESLHNLTAEA